MSEPQAGEWLEVDGLRVGPHMVRYWHERMAELERERDEARARLERAETLIRYVAGAEGTDDDMREHVCRCAAAYLEGGEVDSHE